MAQNNQGDTSKRGFASMDEDKQREIASKGGQSVPDEKRSFSQDPQLAAEAGRKGGEMSGGNQSDSGSGQQGSGQQGGGQQNAQQDDRQDGRQSGGGNFADDPQRASEAGRKGGQR